MPQYRQLSQKDSLELELQIGSFAGGENTIGQDQELKVNEARVIENWDSDSLGGMIRSKGFTNVSGLGLVGIADLLLHHFEGSSVRNYIITGGDVYYINGASYSLLDLGAFTSGVLCHGVSAGDKIWVTNSTDNLKYTSIGGSITVPPSRPSDACSRIFYHKSRLIAEGGSKTVYGSRAGVGNWTATDGWSASGDAWNIDLPDLTKGSCMNFPSGNEITVFTEFGAYVLYNFPNIAYRPIAAGHGCSAPYSIALGTEGCYFLSKYPTLGLYIWDGVNFVNLTVNETWIKDVNLSNRVFGIYRENKYYLMYNKIGSGVSYPNVCKYYDARWGKWAERTINPLVADFFGYPAVLTKSNNELYVCSSLENKTYQLEDESNSDNGYPTKANYRTKDFTSIDFGLPMDEVVMKLDTMFITYYGSTGQFSLEWSSDRGLHSGSTIIDLTANGDLLNTTFIMNTSYMAVLPPDRTIVRRFSNNAVGRRFSFSILNSATGDRVKIKKINIRATIVGTGQVVAFDVPSSGITTRSGTLTHPSEGAVVDVGGQTIEI